MFARAGRVAVTIVWLLATETLVLGLAAWPVLVAWSHLLCAVDGSTPLQLLVLALAVLPSVGVVSVLVLGLSALAARLMRWRTPPHAAFDLRRREWPLLRWVCYASCTHVAAVLGGTWLRATPVWIWYLRANGAHVGHNVHVNSLKLSDHNLLTLCDGAVIGADVHLAGHTVERGMVITAPVYVGPGAVIGVESVVGIDVEIGAHAHVGALSFVPKHARLEAGATYVGIPVHPVQPARPGGVGRDARDLNPTR